MSLQDEIAPRYYGEDRIRLTLAEPERLLVAYRPIRIAVDYSRTRPEGVVLPLEFAVTAPEPIDSIRGIYRRFAPAELIFTPRRGGSHLVRLAELFHNRWWGSIVLEIIGERRG